MKNSFPIVSAVLLSLFVMAVSTSNVLADKGKGKGNQARQSGGMSFQSGGSIARSIGPKTGINLQATQRLGNLSQFQSQGLKTTMPKLVNDPQIMRRVRIGGLTDVKPKITTKIPGIKINGGSLSNPARKIDPGLFKPAIVKPMINGPNAKGIISAIKFEPNHCDHPLTGPLWCHYHPVHCHWWWDYCGHLHNCLPVHYCYWNWEYVTFPQVINGGVVVQSSKWYLGVKGMLLPGTGMGVDSVAANSPADRAGIRPGMIITQANGIDLVDEASMQRAIAASGGVLQLAVKPSADANAVAMTVQMELVPSVSF
jgi:membrane-associated protease RseP (regulator of RpoE activity)